MRTHEFVQSNECELERRGKQVRGQPFTKAQLVALLRATGVEVEDIDVTNQRDVVER